MLNNQTFIRINGIYIRIEDINYYYFKETPSENFGATNTAIVICVSGHELQIDVSDKVVEIQEYFDTLFDYRDL